MIRSKLILTAVRCKTVPPKTDALMKFDTWGARKTFVKEVPLERAEDKALWGERKVVKWSRRKQEMIVVTEKQSEIVSSSKRIKYWHYFQKERIDLVRGRISRTFNPFSKKDIIDRHFRYQLRRDQNFYYMANLPYNPEQQNEYLQVAGPVGLAAHVLMNKMDCAVYYECQNAPEGTFEWVEDFRAMQIFDPRKDSQF